eukprot:PITA_28121
MFNPSRGLRQGDPLSRSLFILMMEGLERSVKQANAMGIPTIEEALVYKKILKDFSLATGMEVNLSKSKIFFLNTNIAIQRNISRILGFQRDFLPSKYLGIPLTAEPMQKSILEQMLNKLHDRVKKWTFHALNMADRLVLTNTVLQSITIFMLLALPPPKCVLEQIRDIKRDFLWEKEETRKKWALVSSDKM